MYDTLYSLAKRAVDTVWDYVWISISVCMLLFLRNTVEISIVWINKTSRCRILSIWDNCTIKIEFEKGSKPHKGVLFLRKGPRFSVWCKRTWSSYITFTKRAWTLWPFLMPGNKLLLICIDDLNRLAFCENEAYLEHIEILIRLA